MAQSIALPARATGSRLLLGFVAAFLATLTFHQIGVEICHLVGLTPSTPYNFRGVPPFGVPQVISLAFWGGVWGFVFVLVEPWFDRFPGGYWVGAIVFGAIFPTVFSWLVVAPLKGCRSATASVSRAFSSGPLSTACGASAPACFSA